MKKLVRRGLHTYGYLLIIATIITVFATLTTIWVSAVEFDTNYYKYNGEEGVTITGFNGLSDGENVVIPAKIDGKPILAIEPNGVVTNTSVLGAEKIGTLDLTQAANLKVIEKDAFYVCSNLTGTIESDTIEEIRNNAFDSCTGLTSLDLPNLTSVGDYAFSGCTVLTHQILHLFLMILQDLQV